MKNTILSILFVTAMVLDAIAVISILESAECLPLIPVVTCVLCTLYVGVFYYVNCIR